MKHKVIILTVFLTFALAACGANPIEQLEEEASEQIAEQILEQAGGLEDVNIEVDGDSVSYSVDDGEGGQYDVSVNEEANVDAITGMGFNIAVPSGLGNGRVQRVDENGAEAMITAEFDMVNTTPEQFLQEMHQALVAEGFTYFDMTGQGLTEPVPSDSPVIAYQHAQGYQFSIMYDESGVILGLVNTGTAAGDAGTTVDSMDISSIPTTLDGSVTLDKSDYTIGEAIIATMVINTSLADDAWLGIVPSETPHGLEVDSDAVDVTYVWVRDMVDGLLTLETPIEAGNYDVRLFNTDMDTGVELASISITVSE